MAKKSYKNIEKHDVLMLTLLFLLAIINFAWVMILRDQKHQFDQLKMESFNNTVNISGLRSCYDEGQKPCPAPAKFSLPDNSKY